MTTLAGLLNRCTLSKEASQLFSLTRVAEVTDVLTYSLGGATGTFLIYYYEQKIQPLLGIRYSESSKFVPADQIREASP